ncbi:MAG: septal ring lytic transglycosylase RlpA family protein [Vitreimonas sp.]
MRKSVLIGATRAATIVATLGASAFAPSTPPVALKHSIAKSMPAGASLQTSSDTDFASYDVNGAASWYGGRFHGRRDARGERFDEHAMTAAHRTLPLNSMVVVTNLENGRQVQVRITDRGPYAHRRIIDLSRAAADALGYVDDGVARVNVRALAAQ